MLCKIIQFLGESAFNTQLYTCNDSTNKKLKQKKQLRPFAPQECPQGKFK